MSVDAMYADPAFTLPLTLCPHCLLQYATAA